MAKPAPTADRKGGTLAASHSHAGAPHTMTADGAPEPSPEPERLPEPMLRYHLRLQGRVSQANGLAAEKERDYREAMGAAMAAQAAQEEWLLHLRDEFNLGDEDSIRGSDGVIVRAGAPPAEGSG